MSTATATATVQASSENRVTGLRLPAWLQLLVRTERDIGPLAARLALGLVMLPHGAQKLLGWFGGYGFAATIESFTQHMGLPWIVAFLVVLAESFGAVGLVIGLLGRVAAFGIAAVMVGAILMGHLQHGFFMNWSGQQAGEGFEYHLLALGLAAVTLVAGSGALSVDRWLSRRAAR